MLPNANTKSRDAIDNNIIDVIQLNLNKAYNAGINLLGKTNKAKCFLALIQEQYFFKGNLAAIPWRSDAIPSKRTGGPRAAIFADKCKGTVKSVN